MAVPANAKVAAPHPVATRIQCIQYFKSTLVTIILFQFYFVHATSFSKVPVMPPAVPVPGAKAAAPAAAQPRKSGILANVSISSLVQKMFFL